MVAAVRLPNNAFAGSAQTEVVTDIIILRKVAKPAGQPWTDIAKAGEATVWKEQNENGAVGQNMPILVNRYFVDNPQMVLGNHSLEGSMYRENEYTVTPNGPYEQIGERAASALASAVEPGDYSDSTVQISAGPMVIATAEQRPGSFHYKDGVLGMIVEQEWKPLQEANPALYGEGNLTNRKRVAAFVRLRDAYLSHMALQNTNATDSEVEASTAALSDLYASTVREHSNLWASGGFWKAVRSDPNWYFVQGMEVVKTVEDPITGKPSEIYLPADVLKKRTMRPQTPPTTAENLLDALRISQAWKGDVDEAFMAELLDMSIEDMRNQLITSGAAFLDPKGTRLVPADRYLSGNVRKKLLAAEHAAQKDPATYSKNVEALKKILPASRPVSEINPQLGGSWIDPKLIELWAESIGIDLKVTHTVFRMQSKWSRPGGKVCCQVRGQCAHLWRRWVQGA
jgi:hypothetical protein